MFKTRNVPKLTKDILESSHRVLQVTSKRKALKQPVYILKSVTNFFRKHIEVSQNTPVFILIWPPITKQNNGPLKT